VLVVVLLVSAAGIGSLLPFGLGSGQGASARVLPPSTASLRLGETSRSPWHGANAVLVRVGPAGGGATVTVAPSHGFVASPVNLSGGGFAVNSTMAVTFGAVSVTACSVGGLVSNASGNFSCVFPVPLLASGPYLVNATDGVASASAMFSIDPPGLAVTPVSGVVGTPVNVTGAGFAPSTSLAVSFGGRTISACTAGGVVTDAAGNFSCVFSVPTSRAGTVDVNASDGTNAATALFTVLAPVIAMTPTASFIGESVRLNGSGFALHALLTVSFGSKSVTSCSSGSLHANATGFLACSFAVPTTVAGTVVVNASDGTNLASTTFTVWAPTLAAAPSSGLVGSSVDVSGPGYVPAASIVLAFGPSGVGACSAGSLTANATGILNCTFSAPGLVAGTYDINASDGTNHASAAFVLGPPTLSLAPSSGYVGTPVAASGAGYRASTVVTLSFGSVAVTSCTSGSLRTSAQGNLACTFPVPHTTAGSHTVTVSDGTNSATAAFLVVPDLMLTPTNGTIGTSVQAVGTGFDATSSFTVAWNASFTLYAGTTDMSGGFSISFNVPNSPGGSHIVTAQEGSNGATAGFSLLPSVSLNPSAGMVGRAVNFHAQGLDASAGYTVLWDGTTTLCSGTTDSNGGLACSFDVPASAEGVHTVKVVEGAYAPSATFSVSPNVVLDPAGGAVAAPILLIGTGFEAATGYLACFQENVSACSSGTTFTTAANGSTQSGTYLTVPTLPPGSYYVDVSRAGSFVAAAPFSVTSANLELSPSSGPIGTAVNISGSAFTPNTQYTYCFQRAVQACSGSDVFTTNNSGNVPFGVALTVPSVAGGSYYVDVSRAGLVVALAAFLLTPLASVAPGSGEVASSAVVTASGLDSTAIYSVDWNATVSVCSGTTGAAGTLSCTFSVPSAPAGPHTLTISEGGYSPTVEFNVVPGFAANASSGTVGSAVIASGSGFDALSLVQVSWNGATVLCGATSNAVGAFSCGFTVPSAPEGPGTVVAAEGTLRTSLVFVVTPSAALSRANATVGGTVDVTGAGLPASEPFDVAWNASLTVCMGSTTLVGAFSCAFAVPPAAAGTYGLNVTSGANTLSPLPLRIVPAFSLSSSIGYVGSALNATGTGLDALASFAVAWNASDSPCSGHTDVNGGFTCMFLVPLAPGGLRSINLTEGSRILSVPFTIAPRATLTPSDGTPGASVSAYATGFAPGLPVTVTWNATATLCTGTTSAEGAYLCGFVVPTASKGTYDVTVTVGSATPVTGVFTVNGTVPTPAASSSTPVPWWIVAVVVVVAGVVLLGLVVLRRRRSTPRSEGEAPAPESPVGPSGPSSAAPAPSVPEYVELPAPISVPGSTPAPPPTAVAAATPAPSPPPESPPSPGEVPDIDLLIDQLDKIAAEILKKPSPAEAKETSEEDSAT
jgi:hypothetical protein